MKVLTCILARFGMGMNAESTAGVPGIFAGQVAMNGLDVAEKVGLGGPTGFTGGISGTMRRDIGRTAGIALTAAARKAILDTGERPEDVAVDTRTNLARVMAHRKALIAKRRAGGDVGRNEIGRSLSEFRSRRPRRPHRVRAEEAVILDELLGPHDRSRTAKWVVDLSQAHPVLPTGPRGIPACACVRPGHRPPPDRVRRR